MINIQNNIPLLITIFLLIISIILNFVLINKIKVQPKTVQTTTVQPTTVKPTTVQPTTVQPTIPGVQFMNKLDNYMTEDLRCPKLEKNGVVRVYVSGGMFDIADTLYSIGPSGMFGDKDPLSNSNQSGLDYQSINLIDMICNLDADQIKELQELCVLWDVPWYGIVGEIKKMGWECYCPVRDGLTMATIIAAVSKCSWDDVTKSYDAGKAGFKNWNESLFNEKNFPKQLNSMNEKEKEDLLNDFRGKMITAVGINIGANDLYNMYSTCNACIMNYNGTEPDAGALAEIGSLGARGVPSVIIKGSMQGDFSGISNPMPVMATTCANTMIPNLTNNPGSIFYTMFGDNTGALTFLKNKVNKFIENKDSDDPLTNGNYNNLIPLPPLQIFWSDLGSKSYFLKHKSKSIVTLPNGKTDFEKDYTEFWYKNIVSSTDTSGLVQVAKAMVDNLDYLKKSDKYKNIFAYWS